MTDATNVNVLEGLDELVDPRIAPDRSGGARLRYLFKAGQDNTFEFTAPDGSTRTGYITFGGVRLTRFAVRRQVTGISSSNPETRLSCRMGQVFDDEEIGEIDADGNKVPHPLYRYNLSDDEAKTNLIAALYAHWQHRIGPDPRGGAVPLISKLSGPHRGSANQWVTLNNSEMVVEVLNFLASIGWTVLPNPPQQRNRDTRDDVVAFPPASEDITNTGVRLSSFQVLVNPNYTDEDGQLVGFSNFYSGVTEQQRRLDEVAASEDVATRQQLLEALVPNVRFLSGVYMTQGAYQPRAMDVGAFDLDPADAGRQRAAFERDQQNQQPGQFVLYQARASQLPATFFTDLEERNPQTPSAEPPSAALVSRGNGNGKTTPAPVRPTGLPAL